MQKKTTKKTTTTKGKPQKVKKQKKEASPTIDPAEKKEIIQDTQDTDEQKKDSTSPLTKAAIAIIIITVAIFLITSFQKTVDVKGTEDWCKEIENDPGLMFPCSCSPLKDTPDNQKDIIENKTKPICRCTCDIGNGTIKTFSIRQAEEGSTLQPTEPAYIPKDFEQ